MLRVAAIGVAILAGEGVAIEALQAADVLALGPVDAIDLVLNPQRLIALYGGKVQPSYFTYCISM